VHEIDFSSSPRIHELQSVVAQQERGLLKKNCSEKKKSLAGSERTKDDSGIQRVDGAGSSIKNKKRSERKG